MKKALVLFALSSICFSCNESPGTDEELGGNNSTKENAEIATTSQALGKTCWITSWNSQWTDPNNPGSGKHVVAWFYCTSTIPTGTWEVTTDIMYDASDWMVWSNGGNNYQVFIDGWYYWPLVWFTGFTQEEAIYTVHLS